MNLLSLIGLGRPDFSSSKPDISHIGTRMVGAPAVVPRTRRGGLFFDFGPQASVEQVRRAYTSTAFFLANYRARNFARHLTNLRVERRLGQGEFEEVQEDFPWVMLLRRPNNYMSPLAFWQWVSLARDLTRGAHCIVEHVRIGGAEVPVYLHPVFEEDGPMRPDLNGVGEVVGWVHQRADGQNIPYRPQDVVRIAHEHPIFRGRGASLIEAAAYELDHALAARVYGRDAARDQGKPNIHVHFEDKAEPEEGNAYARAVGQIYRTGSGDDRVFWTSGSMTAESFTVNAKDMQFLEAMEANEERLFTLFETSRQMFSGEAYATGLNGALRAFAVQTVQPNVEEIADRLEFEFERIFRADPSALRIAAPNCVPVDREQQAKIDEMRIRSGVVNANEVRRREGMEEYEGGDAYFISSTLQPVSLAGDTGL